MNSLDHSPARRAAALALVAATLFLCYFQNLGAVGLVGADEPRYAWIAREMAESGDWITPRLYGQPWFEKPVLYYWSAALSFKLFGVSEVTARLPSAIFALLATLALAWLARRVYGSGTAYWLLLLLPSSVGMTGFSHAAATDMPFAAALTLAMVCIAIVLELTRNADSPILPRTPWAALLGLGFFSGLAVLAKGPAALILSGGAVLLWTVVTKRWRKALLCLHPSAVAAFCATALPWYVACARRNPDFLRVFFLEHNFKRFLTPQFQHIQPFWYYAAVVLAAFLPWTVLLLWCIFAGVQKLWRERAISPFTAFLLCWIFFCLAFFTISKSKLPGYILPALPAIGLLLARSYTRISPERSTLFRRMMIAVSTLLALASALLWGTFGRPHASGLTAHAARSAAWIILLFALASALLSFRASKNNLLAASSSLCVVPVLILLLQFPSLSRGFLPYDPSGKTLAREITLLGLPAQSIYAGPMRRGMQYSLSFYLHSEVQAWDPEKQQEGYLILGGKNCSRFVAAPWTCSSAPLNPNSSDRFIYRVELKKE